MDLQKDIEHFRKTLKKLGTKERADQEKRYLKSSMVHFGVKVPEVRRVAGEYKKANADMDREGLLVLVDMLWRDEHYEMKSTAIALLELYVGLLSSNEMILLERMLDQCETWAHVDWIAPHVASELVVRFPMCLKRLERWSNHPNFWVRRASMLALLTPLRKGGGDFELFARFAESMLDEKEFFIRKAIGWILREVSKKRPELTFDFLKRNIDHVSPLTFKEGLRKLPEAMQVELEGRFSGSA